MNRRRVLVGAGALLAAPFARAQQAGRTYRVGWIGSTDSFREPYSLAFVQRLGDLGFAEGRNLVFDRRHTGGRLEQFPALAAEMAKNRYDLLFTAGAEINLATATQISRDTPIVVVAVDFDPVATGDVASLARPGGRVTGLSALQSTLPAKRLELLRELLPRAGKVAVFANEQTTAQLSLVQGTARRIGLALQVIDFKRPPFNYEAGFAEAVRGRADALFVLGSGLFVPARRLLPKLALESKLPSVFHHAQWVEVGGLMSYGFNFPGMWRRAAEMVVSILKGAKPADVPMEQPTSYELAFNLKTASALGLKIPQPLLVRADRVVQ